jgi:hypothetical protein
MVKSVIKNLIVPWLYKNIFLKIIHKVVHMGEKKFGRGGNNPHMKTTKKKPCSVCGSSVDHYPDGTISKHKVYEFKKVSGVMKKTSKWTYCSNRTWS